MIPSSVLVELLPLQNLKWPDFQAFCEAVVAALPEVKKCEQYGVHGEDQKGIDIVALTNDNDKWTFQCKRVKKKLSASKARQIISEVEVQAERHHAMIAIEATTEAQDVFDTPGWQLWDQRVISRKLRFEIPPHRAIAIVNTFFGKEWVTYFLGHNPDFPFVELDTFISQPQNKLQRETKKLHGRNTALIALADAAIRDQQHILIGARGGTGKTRFLIALAERIKDTNDDSHIFFTNADTTFADLFHLTDSKRIYLFVDDAHRYQQINKVIEAAATRTNLTLIIATRPHSTARIQTALRYYNISDSQVKEHTLEKLTLGQAVSIVQDVLKENTSHATTQIATLFQDTPLLLVLSAKLLNDSSESIQSFASAKEIRSRVLTSYLDDLVAIATDSSSDRRSIESLLALIAACGPIHLARLEAIDVVSSFLKQEKEDVKAAIGRLSSCGLLHLTRSQLVRIIPDVLSDYILERACFSGDILTGFHEKVYSQLSQFYGPNILRNLAEMDWRARQDGRDGIDLIARIYKTLEVRLTKESISQQVNLLAEIEDPAHYQPHLTYQLLKSTYLTGKAVETPWIREKIAKLLRIVGYAAPGLAYEICSDLWRLDPDDSSKSLGFEELKTLASYQANKSSQYSDIALTFIEDVALHQSGRLEKVIELLEGYFVKAGWNGFYHENKFYWPTFTVNKQVTDPLRNRALKALQRLSERGQLESLAVLKVIRTMIRDPEPAFSRVVSESECLQWEEEQLKLLALAETIMSVNTSPAFIHLYRDVLQAVSHLVSKILQEEGKQREMSLVLTFDNEIVELLLGRPHFRDINWEVDELDIRSGIPIKALASCAKELANRIETNSYSAEWLISIVSECSLASSKDTYLYLLLAHLATEHPLQALSLLSSLVALNSDLLLHCGNLLRICRRLCPAESLGILQQLEASTEYHTHHLVLSSYWGYDWPEENRASDVALFLRLYSDDPTLKTIYIRSLLALSERSWTDFELALSQVHLSDTPDLGEVLSETCRIARSRIASEHIIRLDTMCLSTLESISPLRGYNILTLIKAIYKDRPMDVVEYFVKRMNSFTYKFNAVPSSDEMVFDEPQSDCELMSVINYCINNLQPSFENGHLLKLLTSNFSTRSIDTLIKLMPTLSSNGLINIASFVSMADHNFCLVNVAFVDALLGLVNSHEKDVRDEVEGYLRMSAYFGSRITTVGQPSTKDVEVKVKSEELSSNLNLSITTRGFYSSLASMANRRIQEDINDTER